MQGFPIGGSRIRLSWGRSQCRFFVYATMTIVCFILTLMRCWLCRFRVGFTDKAAQAAAEAAQTAAMQSELHHPVPQPPPQLQSQPISPAPPLPQQHRSGSTTQPQNAMQSSSSSSSVTSMSTVSPEQAVELIQKLGLMKYLEHPEQLAAYEGPNMQ